MELIGLIALLAAVLLFIGANILALAFMLGGSAHDQVATAPVTSTVDPTR